jgi:hypothetical protein
MTGESRKRAHGGGSAEAEREKKRRKLDRSRCKGCAKDVERGLEEKEEEEEMGGCLKNELFSIIPEDSRDGDRDREDDEEDKEDEDEEKEDEDEEDGECGKRGEDGRE